MKLSNREKILITAAVLLAIIDGAILYSSGIFKKHASEYYPNNATTTEETTEKLDVFQYKASNISQWKEYKSANYGFSFKYPEDWDIYSGVEPAGRFALQCNMDKDQLCAYEFVMASRQPYRPQGINIFFDITAVRNRSGMSISELDSKLVAESGDNPCVKNENGCMSDSYLLTDKFVYTWNWDCSIDDSVYQNQVFNYFISLLRANGNAEKFDVDSHADFQKAQKQVFELILSTFKVLE